MLANLLSHHFSHPETDNVVVIGLGRFGSAVAESLVNMGHDVMGIDSDDVLIQQWSETLTHAIQCDSTNVAVMKQIGVADFKYAIVGIGSDLSASLMTIMVLLELGIEDIWVKATSAAHGKIATRIGAHHVVYPEAAMAARVAHLVTGKILDFIEFDDDFAIAKIRAPAFMHNRSIYESEIQKRFNVMVVGVKKIDGDLQHITGDTLISPDDLLVISGLTQHIYNIANQDLSH